MEGEWHDTVIDFVERVQQPRELLAKQRRTFTWVRWILRAGFGSLLILILTMLIISVINGEIEGKWYVLPLPIIGLLLLWAIERARFCPECNAMYGLPVWKPIPAFCPNCQRLLDPARVLLDPPGVLDLTNERYLSDAEPVLKLIVMVILLGIKDRSTEIRFEPGREEFQLRYRCGGVLYEMVPPPLFLQKALIGTLKSMARLQPVRSSQTGTLRIKVDNSTMDARIETQPTEFGENVLVWMPEMHDVQVQWLDRYLKTAANEGKEST